MTFLKRSTLFLLLIVLANACTPQRKLIYLQGDAETWNDTSSFVMYLFPGDILMVQLFTVNQDAFPGITNSSVASDGNDTRNAYEKGFVVDQRGNLTLPYIGTMHLAGLSLDDAHDTINNRFKSTSTTQ
ncbi:MAG: polysaccharide biosynthesis/export family protein [Bacteroidetes bacterium]|nr:polysaccharide biosynthesis/export family protein [Bacteroidota bacterium]